MGKIEYLSGGVVRYNLEDDPSDNGEVYESAGTRHRFNSQAEMTKAMRNPAYKTSQSYRDVVKQVLANSDPVVLGLAPDRSQDGAPEFHEASAHTRRKRRMPSLTQAVKNTHDWRKRRRSMIV